MIKISALLYITFLILQILEFNTYEWLQYILADNADLAQLY
jgi:hypothetical protein